MKLLIVLMAVFAFPASLFAHHSDAGVDIDTEIWIEGEVVEFRYLNPHSYLTIRARGPNGEIADWKLQTGGPFNMNRRGWTKDTLQPGDNVSALLRPAFNDRPYGLLSTVLKDGGQIEGIEYDNTRTYETAIASSLEGPWRGDRSTIGDFTEFFDRIVPTEKGRLAKAAFDPLSEMNPITTCLARPTPSTIVSSGGFLSVFTFLEDGNLKLTNEIFNTERIIYLDGRDHPPITERTLMGHSIARWEGETLVVDTRNFTDHLSPYQDGLPSGAHKHMVERFRISEDRTRLSLDMVLEDSEFIAEPLVHHMEWIYAPSSKPVYWECDPESTAAFLPD